MENFDPLENELNPSQIIEMQSEPMVTRLNIENKEKSIINDMQEIYKIFLHEIYYF